MSEICSYVCGELQKDRGEPTDLFNPTTDEVVAQARIGGLDLEEALRFARDKGAAALRSMSFVQRAELLEKIAGVIHEHRDELLDTAVFNSGSTRSGAKFDVDGAASTLAAYAAMGKELGDAPHLLDGDSIPLGHGARLSGRHAFVPRGGVAVLINAFNFPAWGFAEKAATAILGGMPVISKPGTATSWTAGRLTDFLVEADVLPPGVFTQILGPITDLLVKLGPQDQVAFTGSSFTGFKVRSLEALLKNSVPVNVEADSLNAAVLAGDIDTDSACYSLFLRDVVREMTEKTGQKCTATRRIFVESSMIDKVVEDLGERLDQIVIGDPQLSEVRMGPLSTRRQMEDVHAGMKRLAEVCETVYGKPRPDSLVGIEGDGGCFVGPMVFVARDDRAIEEVHREEVFGPALSIVPYDGSSEEAVRFVGLGGGMLVSSVYADNRTFLKETVLGIAPWCGRVVVVDSKAEGYSLPTGMVLPQLNHGGPGRAGGGAELGGVAGIEHFMQRTAFQGTRGLLDRILG